MLMFSFSFAAGLAMEYKASAEDVARVCHAHPTGPSLPLPPSLH